MSDLRTGERNERKEEQALYRLLPSLGDLMLEAEFVSMSATHSRALVADAARAVLSRMRKQIRTGELSSTTLMPELQRIAVLVSEEITAQQRPSLLRVLNATGMLLHTNLGRAPLSQAALDQVVTVARGYSNLELNLDTGQRGRRDDHVEPLILRFLAAQTASVEEDIAQTYGAIVVNNCAAATFLALNSLAEGGDVVVSRGELVEIGGGFRIPDILRKSGASLREVGTTNRTRIADYEAAVSDNTRLLLRVHQSNFKIEGFTERPSLEELIALGERKKVPVFEDQGTGLMLPLETLDILAESSFVESFREGVPLIAASGDKLMGGPQCGLLVGHKDLIETIRRNPLLRAFRVDKLTYAALEATLLAYATGRADEIPVVRMMRMSAETVHMRCQAMVSALAEAPFEAEVIAAKSVIGGGTTPGATLDSFAVCLRHATLSCTNLATALRRASPAVVARVQNDRVLLDLRTIFPEQEQELIAVLKQVAREPQQ